MDIDDEADLPPAGSSQSLLGASAKRRLSDSSRKAEDDPESSEPAQEPKRKRFFVKEASDDVVLQEEKPQLNGAGKKSGKSKPSREASVVEIIDDSDDDENHDKSKYGGKHASTSTQVAIKIEETPKKPRTRRNPTDFTGERYIGREYIDPLRGSDRLNTFAGFQAEGWATMSSKKDVFGNKKIVKIERPATSVIDQKKHATSSAAAKEKDNNAIVRFRNYQDREVGRFEQKTAA